MPQRLLLAAAALVLPLAGLLFAQWPLRDWLQAYSRQANDLGQVLFALYIAVAVTAASEAGAHLAAARQRLSPRAAAIAVLACTGPWALYLLVITAQPVWQSLRTLEKFPETLDPGYFLVRIALWLLAALVLLQALRRAMRHG
ncbi:hypothetical protein HHL11_17965 [Ramlibacter sp. G-1-2-2]|uniref:DUF4149 domain-containing protein n=1 Tax=Ramlibacter agri TaxID=2728837 RepID=A0A848H6X6_9BURK|nr:hypothetical protein [Ramlibacter agri]NML45642.1 hypothetical protein [Ramlibacter agri]